MTRYTMHCPACHRGFVVRGTDEPDTNAFIPNEDDFAEHQKSLGCNHDDAYITDVDYDDGDYDS